MRHRTRLRGDDGVTLMLALIVITVIAAVTTALLSQSFTNTRATESARAQGSSAYAADAAAKFAVNQIRQISNNVGSFCSTIGATSTETLSGFYPPTVTAPQLTATIQCRPDANDPGPNPTGGTCTPGVPCANSGPGTALLTLDTSGTGIYTSLKNGQLVSVRGGVFSNSAINNAFKGTLQNSWCPSSGCGAGSPRSYLVARGSCSGTITFTQTGGSPPPGPVCNYPVTNDPRGADPQLTALSGSSYNPPAIVSGAPTISTCAGSAKYQTVSPGSFVGASGLALLNGLTGCTNNLVQFKPGVYYFDLPGTWSIPAKLTVVGGTFGAAYNPNNTASWPDLNACISPSASGAGSNSGVEFVAGGATQFAVNSSAGSSGSALVLCASTTSDGPPMALYGLKPGSLPGGTTAETLCTPAGTGSTACAVLNTDNCPKCSLSVQGSVYTPRGVLSIGDNNTGSKNFTWGVVANGFEFSATGSIAGSQTLVDVPDGQPRSFPVNIYYLSVYVCAGTSACPTGGTANLQAAIQTQTTPGNASVLSWSVNR